MRSIEVAERSVQGVVLRDIDPQRAVAVGIPGDAHRLRPCVVDADLETVGETAIEPGLQGVVLAVANRRDETRLSGPPELLIQLAARLASADRRPVQFLEPELIDLSCRHVRRFTDQAPAQLLLERHVPRPDLAADEVVGQREHRDRTRDGHEPAPQVGIGDERNAVGRAADEGERIRRVEEQVQHGRMIRAQRSGQRVRIVGDAESGAEHRSFPGPIGDAQARREERLAHMDAEILRHRSDAANHHLVRVDVVALEAAGGPRRNGEVLPASAVGDRHPGRRLPLVADV